MSEEEEDLDKETVGRQVSQIRKIERQKDKKTKRQKDKKTKRQNDKTIKYWILVKYLTNYTTMRYRFLRSVHP